MIWRLARDLGKFPHEIEEMDSATLTEYAALLRLEAREAKARSR